MPSLLPGYTYDIFISYRQKDNLPTPGFGRHANDGWVTEFVLNLRKELEATFKEDISIYFDENPHDGLLETHHVDKSLESKLKCLIFIPIISQTYCDPKSFAWQQEFCAFNKLSKEDLFGREIKLANGNVASRILPVRIHSLDTSDQKTLESEIGSALRAVEFIYKEPGVNRPLSPDDDPSENLNKTKYRNQVNKIANAIKEIIEGLKNFGNPEFYSPNRETVATDLKSSAGKSIVVLPFEDMSPEKDQEYFCDGLSEEIIANLSRINSLKVLSRTSSMHYKGTSKPLKEIAKELAVGYVLEGSVRKQGNEVRITAQLIEAAQDAHLWADKFKGTLEDVFDIQEKVADELVKALEIQLTDTEDQILRKRHTKNTDAHDFYLKGNYHLWMLTPENVSKAIEYFQRAIETDDHYALAYAGLAMSYNGAAWTGYIDPHEAFSKAKRFATKAVEIDDTLAEAHATLGYNYCLDWKWSQAEQQYKRAIELKPNYADAHLYYAWCLGALARIDEAMDEVKKAQQLDPLSVIINANVSFPYYWKRQHDQAITQCLSAIKLDPTFYLSYWFLGIAYASAESYQEAILAFQKAVTFSGGGPYYQAWLGHAHAARGNRSEALKILGDLEELSKQKKSFSYHIALVCIGLGDNEKAMHWLEKAYAERAPLMWYLKIDPYLDPLRSNPKLNTMLIGMGLVKDQRDTSAPTTTVFLPQDKSIAVLPFLNMSNDPDQEYFSDGLTEEIIADLSKVKQLLVISRSSIMTLKGTSKKLKEIAREVNVRYLLEGSVRKSGNNLRITAQLIDAIDDSHVWADKYNGTIEDVFDLQEKISRTIVNELKLKLTPEEERRITERPITNIQAYECYLRAHQEAFNFTEESLNRALQLCHEALTITGDNELLYSLMGEVYLLFLLWGIKVDQSYLVKAEECSQKVYKLNPNSSHDYALRGMIAYKLGDRHESAKLLKLAVDIAPDNSAALIWLVSIYARTGNSKIMRPLLKRLLEIDPLTALVQAWVGWLRWTEGETGARVVDPHLKMLEMDPANPYSRWICAWILAVNGKLQESYPLLDLLERDTPQHGFARIGQFLKAGLQGNKSIALEKVTESLTSWAQTDDIASWTMADGFALIGENQKALDWLEIGMRQGLINYPCLSKYDPLLENIRHEPRFKTLMQRIKVQWEAFEA